MNGKFTTKRLCRAGVIAALYVALTYAFGGLAHQGLVQIRPAEALCILPLFFGEAIPALFIGCMLGNLVSPFAIYDVLIGSLATLVSALLTYLTGKLVRNHAARITVGGIFPVLLNAFLLPVVIVILCADVTAAESVLSYWVVFLSILCSEAVWVYALGTPIYLFVARMQSKNISAFTNHK